MHQSNKLHCLSTLWEAITTKVTGGVGGINKIKEIFTRVLFYFESKAKKRVCECKRGIRECEWEGEERKHKDLGSKVDSQLMPNRKFY